MIAPPCGEGGRSGWAAEKCLCEDVFGVNNVSIQQFIRGLPVREGGRLVQLVAGSCASHGIGIARRFSKVLV